MYRPGMEEVKVDLCVCQNEGVPYVWGAAPGAVFVHEPAPDHWFNRDEINLQSPVVSVVRGIEFWIGTKKLGYITLKDNLTINRGTLLTIEPRGIVLNEGERPFMSLAATLTAIEESQEFERLRRQLLGAVQEGKLWLR